MYKTANVTPWQLQDTVILKYLSDSCFVLFGNIQTSTEGKVEVIIFNNLQKGIIVLKQYRGTVNVTPISFITHQRCNTVRWMSDRKRAIYCFFPRLLRAAKGRWLLRMALARRRAAYNQRYNQWHSTTHKKKREREREREREERERKIRTRIAMVKDAFTKYNYCWQGAPTGQIKELWTSMVGIWMWPWRSCMNLSM